MQQIVEVVALPAEEIITVSEIREEILSYFNKIEKNLTSCDRIRSALLSVQNSTKETSWNKKGDLPSFIEEKFDELKIGSKTSFDDIRDKLNEHLILPLIDQKKDLIEKLNRFIDKSPQSLESENLFILGCELECLELREIFDQKQRLIKLLPYVPDESRLTKPVGEHPKRIRHQATPEQTILVRLTILDARANELSEDAIDDLRTSLAEKTDLSVGSIRSIGAHVIIDADKIMAKNPDLDLSRNDFMRLANDALKGKIVDPNFKTAIDEYLEKFRVGISFQAKGAHISNGEEVVLRVNREPISNGEESNQKILRALLLLYANQASDNEKKIAREELAQQTGNTVKSIGATGAHILIKAKKLASQNNEYSPVELMAGALKVMQGSSVEDSRLGALSQQLHNSIFDIRTENNAPIVTNVNEVQKVSSIYAKCEPLSQKELEFLEKFYTHDERQNVPIYILGEFNRLKQFSELGFDEAKINILSDERDIETLVKTDFDITPIICVEKEIKDISDLDVLRHISSMSKASVIGSILSQRYSYSLNQDEDPSIGRFLIFSRLIMYLQQDKFEEFVNEIAVMARKSSIQTREIMDFFERLSAFIEQETALFKLGTLPYVVGDLKVPFSFLVRANLSSPVVTEYGKILKIPDDLRVPSQDEVFDKKSLHHERKQELDSTFYLETRIGFPKVASLWSDLTSDQRGSLIGTCCQTGESMFREGMDGFKIKDDLLKDLSRRELNIKGLFDAICFDRPIINHYEASENFENSTGMRSCHFQVSLESSVPYLRKFYPAANFAATFLQQAIFYMCGKIEKLPEIISIQKRNLPPGSRFMSGYSYGLNMNLKSEIGLYSGTPQIPSYKAEIVFDALRTFQSIYTGTEDLVLYDKFLKNLVGKDFIYGL